MADHVSPMKRSAIMALVKTRNTGPELIARKMLHRKGYRFRIHEKKLPGSPDIVFPRRKKVIFVHGCFWHAHRCRYGRLPKSRLTYWGPKIKANEIRDTAKQLLLTNQGWEILVLWQCELKKPDEAFRKAVRFLGQPGQLRKVQA